MVKALILHGGAGAWRVSTEGSLSSDDRREKALEVMRRCTEIGWRTLNEKNNAVDAVVMSIKCMEDSGVLNAGWGSVLDLFGGRSLDAGLMTSNGLIGAVAGVRATRNAIELARIVAEETPHVIIGGSGADELALLKRLAPLPPPPARVIELYNIYMKKLLRGEDTRPYIRDLMKYLVNNREYYELLFKNKNIYDTVGACALDDNGLLVAGVSTGGLILKMPGRIGDSPIPGAGFYASEHVACSATGIGEKIIRTMPCKQLDIEYAETRNLEKASDNVLSYVNKMVGSDTLGFIAVDIEGNITWRFNTEGILVGYVHEGEVIAKLDLKSI